MKSRKTVKAIGIPRTRENIDRGLALLALHRRHARESMRRHRAKLKAAKAMP